jgi:hypothetical protein
VRLGVRCDVQRRMQMGGAMWVAQLCQMLSEVRDERGEEDIQRHHNRQKCETSAERKTSRDITTERNTERKQ